MTTVNENPWGSLVLRGIFAVAFGIATWMIQRTSLFTLLFLFGTYALAEGVGNVVGGVEATFARQRVRVSMILQGILSMLIGALVLWLADVTEVVLVYFIAVRAILMGAFEMGAAVRLRRIIAAEWALLLAGLLSIGFGVVLVVSLVAPSARAGGALALLSWIGAYGVALGTLQLAAGLRIWFQLRREPRGPSSRGFAHGH